LTGNDSSSRGRAAARPLHLQLLRGL